MDLCNYREIRELLTQYGFNFSKSLGQNFLTASWVPERIALESGINKNCGVLEIGPGIGCLTAQLSVHSKKVVAVELDKRLIPVLGKTISHLDNVEVIQGDIMKIDINKIAYEHFGEMPIMVCANLPYSITTPVLTKLIESKIFESITVMIQREVAQRICAKPGSADYGSFTVYANYYTEPKKLFDVSPDCFVPKPKVTSTVISLKIRQHTVCEISDEKHFFKIVRAAFAQRRKTLVNCLSSVFGLSFTKAEIEEILIVCGFDPRIRGEVLGIEDFAKVSTAMISKNKELLKNDFAP